MQKAFLGVFMSAAAAAAIAVISLGIGVSASDYVQSATPKLYLVAVRRVAPPVAAVSQQPCVPKADATVIPVGGLGGEKIPRLPGASRLNYDGNGISQYSVRAASTAVLQYYASELAARCWQVAAISDGQAVWTKDGASLKIEVAEDGLGGSSTVDYQLAYGQVLGVSFRAAQTSCPTGEYWCSGTASCKPNSDTNCPASGGGTTTCSSTYSQGTVNTCNWSTCPTGCNYDASGCASGCITGSSGTGSCSSPEYYCAGSNNCLPASSPCPSTSGGTATCGPGYSYCSSTANCVASGVSCGTTGGGTCTGGYTGTGATYTCNWGICPNGCSYDTTGCANGCSTGGTTSCSTTYSQGTPNTCSWSVCPNGCTYDSTGCATGCSTGGTTGGTGGTAGTCLSNQVWCTGSAAGSGWCQYPPCPTTGTTGGTGTDQASCTAGGGLWCMPINSPHCHTGPNPSPCEADTSGGGVMASCVAGQIPCYDSTGQQYCYNGTTCPATGGGSTWPSTQTDCTAQGKTWCPASGTSSGACYYSGPCPVSCPSGQYSCNGVCKPNSDTNCPWTGGGGGTVTCGSGQIPCWSSTGSSYCYSGTTCPASGGTTWPTTESGCVAGGNKWCPSSSGSSTGACYYANQTCPQSCPSGQYWCQNTGTCKLNSDTNCSFGGAGGACPSGQNWCSSLSRCVNPGEPCGTGSSCGTGYYWCNGGCIPNSSTCSSSPGGTACSSTTYWCSWKNACIPFNESCASGGGDTGTCPPNQNRCSSSVGTSWCQSGPCPGGACPAGQTRCSSPEGNSWCQWGPCPVSCPSGQYQCNGACKPNSEPCVPAGPGPGSGPSFIRGDANGDGQVNISDASAITNYLNLGGSLSCADAADVNDSGNISQADADALLGFLAAGTAGAPPQPYPTAGSDPTPDGLQCSPVGPGATGGSSCPSPKYWCDAQCVAPGTPCYGIVPPSGDGRDYVYRPPQECGRGTYFCPSRGASGECVAYAEPCVVYRGEIRSYPNIPDGRYPQGPFGDGQYPGGPYPGQYQPPTLSNEQVSQIEYKQFEQAVSRLPDFEIQFASAKRQFKQIENKLKSCKFQMPKPLVEALAAFERALPKMKAATDFLEVEATMREIWFDAGPEMERWADAMPELLRQCEFKKRERRIRNDVRTIERDFTTLKRRAGKREELVELVTDAETKVVALKVTVEKFFAVLGKDVDAAEEASDTLWSDIEDARLANDALRGALNARSELSRMDRELRQRKVEIDRFARAGKDVAEVREAYNAVKEKVDELRTAVRERADIETIVDLVNELHDLWDELLAPLEELRGYGAYEDNIIIRDRVNFELTDGFKPLEYNVPSAEASSGSEGATPGGTPVAEPSPSPLPSPSPSPTPSCPVCQAWNAGKNVCAVTPFIVVDQKTNKWCDGYGATITLPTGKSFVSKTVNGEPKGEICGDNICNQDVEDSTNCAKDCLIQRFQY